jgi:hypothetical protein
MLAALLIGSAGPAEAGPITFEFTGTVSSVVFDTPPAEVTVGDPFTLRVTFESTAPDTSPSDTLGTYSATSIEFSAGEYAASAASGVIRITNDGAIGDAFQIRSSAMTGPPLGGFELREFQDELIELGDESGAAFASDALPLIPFDLTPFFESGSASLSLQFGPAEESTHFAAQIESLGIPSTVPEPGSLTLLGAGAAGLIGLSRAKKCRRWESNPHALYGHRILKSVPSVRRNCLPCHELALS